MKRKCLSIILMGALVLTACQAAPVAPSPTAAPTSTSLPQATATPTAEVEAPAVLNVMTHDSFAVSANLVNDFEAANNVRVNFIKAGDAGSALNRLILLSLTGAPEADVFYGLDNTFLSCALEANVLEAYAAPALQQIPAEFQLDPGNRALPVDYGDVCINYDKAYFQQKDIPLPESLEQLTDPTYYGLLAMENPATSSPGLSFMLATIAHFGEGAWLDWWGSMKENQVVLVSDWETAYYTNFSGSSGKGAQPMVVSYASSPAAEVVYASSPLTEAPTGALTGDGMCWRQVEFAGIVKGTAQRALAEKFIDFMLGQSFQEDMPLQMFVYPVLSSAQLPAVFSQYSQIPAHPATLDPQQIAANRDAWVQSWTDLMLR